MRLTLQTDYTLRVLMFLGVNRDKLSTIQEISDCYGISKNHLMKVVHQLSKLDYIDTVRGKNGGIRLKLDPQAINLGILIRKTEPDLDIVECFSSGAKCKLKSCCSLSGIMSEALTAFIATLEKYTLSDLLVSKGLHSLLHQSVSNSSN